MNFCTFCYRKQFIINLGPCRNVRVNLLISRFLRNVITINLERIGSVILNMLDGFSNNFNEYFMLN